MEIEKAIEIIKSFDIPEINEAMRFVLPKLHERDVYKNNFKKMVNKYKEILDNSQKDKVIELNKTYFVSEWSWSPMCDGRFVYEETIREHTIINGIDCYFTNTNNRIYFKEDIYETRKEAEKACEFQNSFTYEYEMLISRERDVREYISFVNYHWRLKN